ncbi:MAG TPA: hypothetical protein VMT11_17050 [Myxococcaceae bacterium]|nr:hypothetical protein [Myxococcaceae bacterium]
MSAGIALAVALLAAPGASAPAVEALADQLREVLVAARPEAPVAVAVQGTSSALCESVGAVLAARLTGAGLPALVLPGGPDAPARARGQGARSLLSLQLRVDGQLAAAGELRSVWRNFWAGRTPVEAGPARLVSAAVPADPAARLLAAAGASGASLILDPAPLARFAVRTAALASGDLDGDGRPELAVLVGDEVVVLDAAGQPVARHGLSDLPPAPAPVREPFGTLCIANGLLAVASASAEAAVTLQLRGSQLMRLGHGGGPTLGCGASAEPATFVPGMARLQLDRGQEREVVWGGDARGGHRLLLFPDGTARWSAPGAGPRVLGQVGAGAALVSWGGELRVAASSAAAAPAEDRLRLLGPGAEEPSLAVAGRILQVQPTDDLGGAPALVLGVWTAEGGSELRVVRGAR